MRIKSAATIVNIKIFSSPNLQGIHDLPSLKIAPSYLLPIQRYRCFSFFTKSAAIYRSLSKSKYFPAKIYQGVKIYNPHQFHFHIYFPCKDIGVFHFSLKMLPPSDHYKNQNIFLPKLTRGSRSTIPENLSSKFAVEKILLLTLHPPPPPMTHNKIGRTRCWRISV